MAFARMPIYIIGAGGIVNTAHLPAYALAGYTVAGICDLDEQKAKDTAARFSIPRVFRSAGEMIAALPEKAIVDMAVPGTAVMPLLQLLPSGTAVLIQKPMGEDIKAAREILSVCREKKLRAAINFQLRYAPYILEVKKMLEAGQLGTINDIEINVNVYTPWHLWDFLFSAPRVEILYHSIHYIDLVRYLLGNPLSVFARTTKHPAMKELASVRSNIILDYGEMVRANILTNHCHFFGTPKQQSYIKIEGDKGAVLIRFGALINYPRGEADSFEYVVLGEGKEPVWQEKKIEGSWFPHAFMGSMRELMLELSGVKERADNSAEDCIHTMACVEAAYLSSEKGGINPATLI